MDDKKIKKLIKILNDNDLSEVTIEEEGVKITVRRGDITVVEASADASKPGGPVLKIPGHEENVEAKKLEDKYCKVVSPMVGTFYRGPSPEADAFVEEGDSVEVGQTLAVIEAMKLMNEITAEEAGRIVKIAIDDGEPVEFGQALFYYEPQS